MADPIAPKPTLALLHGWGLGSSVWHPVAAALAGLFNVRLLDLPGYNDRPRDHRASFVQTAESFATALPENTIVCGWSLGAMLSMQIALLAPEKISRLILIGATPSFTQRGNWPHALSPELVDAFCQSVEQTPTETRQRFVALLNQGDRHARPLTRSMSRALATDHSPDAASLLVGLTWLRDIDLRAHIAKIKVPTLIIHGEKDPLMPMAAAAWLHEQLDGSQLEAIPGAAHAPFLHDPERFVALIDSYCHASAIQQAACSPVV